MKPSELVSPAEIDAMALELVIELLREDGHDMEAFVERVNASAIAGNTNTGAAGTNAQNKLKIAKRITELCKDAANN